MAGSFGGSVKLTGESEYTRALKNINSNLKAVSSELKVVSTEFSNNGTKVKDLQNQNDALNKKLKEEQSIVKVCSSAIKEFTEQQIKNKNEIDKLKSSLDSEKQNLDKMKNSTIATSDEIKKQEKVISDLEKKLSKSESAYDSNNRKINDYTIKMNNAKAECSNLSKKIDDNNNVLDKAGNKTKNLEKSVKEFSDEEERAGKNTLTLGDLIKGNLISEGIIAGVKGLTGAMKNLGSSLLDVGKSALKSYADNEQLVGGVETLFKNSSGIVQDYANNAYKTAGLSANDYMETVTSFSASLLQSLNGDTAKSAEVADMAITDMADNANKMGTSMESIQTAYQGFAKQNYTMLDNLKLGYGGTKSEMERLLKDAQKISGVKYDISNLNDVYSAIHVIQGELGITGTTAKEANETISGSIASMKSAYQNLLAGIANENVDLESLVYNFVESIGTVADNIMPRIPIIIEGIIEAGIKGLYMVLPKVVEAGTTLLESLVNGLGSNFDMIFNAISDVISQIIDAVTQLLPQFTNIAVQVIMELAQVLIQNLPQIIECGIQIAVSLVQGISQQLPTLIPQIIDAILQVIPILIDNLPLFIEAGVQLIVGLALGLIQAIPKIIDSIPKIINSLVNYITKNGPQLVVTGIKLIVALSKGLIQAIPQIVASIPKIISSIVKGFATGVRNMKSIGKNLVQGIWNGISDATGWILDKIRGFGKSVLKGIKSIFGIHSPSTVFRDEVGKNLALGLGLGFENEMIDVSKQMIGAIPSEFNVTPTISTELKSNKLIVPLESEQKQSSGNFTAIINNNSKYTSPAENIRLLRKEYDLHKLKYGKV